MFTGCGGDLEWFPHQKGVYNLRSFNPLVVQLVSYYFHIERTAVRRSRAGEDQTESFMFSLSEQKTARSEVFFPAQRASSLIFRDPKGFLSPEGRIS